MNFEDSKNQLFQKKLVSLGAAFHGKHNANPADPEKTILDGLAFFYSDKHNFDMLLGALEHRIHPLINIERLVALAKQDAEVDIPILLALCERLKKNNPKFKYVINELKHINTEKIKIPEDYQQERLIKKWGEDPHFKKFGISVANFFGEKSAKFFALERILKNHPWLRARSLIGANYRADIVYLTTAKIVDRPQDAAKYLGCTRATAYLIFKSLAATPYLNDSDFFTRTG